MTLPKSPPFSGPISSCQMKDLDGKTAAPSSPGILATGAGSSPPCGLSSWDCSQTSARAWDLGNWTWEAPQSGISALSHFPGILSVLPGCARMQSSPPQWALPRSQLPVAACSQEGGGRAQPLMPAYGFQTFPSPYLLWHNQHQRIQKRSAEPCPLLPTLVQKAQWGC